MFCCLSTRKPVVLIASLLAAVIPFTIARNAEPICKNNKTVCEDIEDYPASILDALIKKDLQRYMDLFKVDEPSFGERAAQPDEDSLCSANERTIYPRRGYGKDQKWHYIVNHDNYRQGIRSLECVQANHPCNMTESFPIGSKSACRQGFMYRSLQAYDGEGDIITERQFEIPSCCRCFVSMKPNW